MKIAVMGAGALGGYFGGRLAEAGHEVWLIARGAHLDALRRDGLRIISPNGDAHLSDIHATGDPGAVGPADVVLFMVKNGDVESAGRAIRPMLGPGTMVVTCQNGVSAPERLAGVIGAEFVVPGVARIPGEVIEPGVIEHRATSDMLIFGETDGRASDRCRALHAAMEAAGTTPVIPDDIVHELWSKFSTQATHATLTTITGLDVGPLRENPFSAALFQDAIAETVAVGQAVVPDLPADLAEAGWAHIGTLPGHMHSSMLDDLRRGKPLEHDYLSGDVVRLGAEYGVPTPIHAVLYAALKPVADRLANGA